MTDEKIKEIADFLYSENSSDYVPFRVALTTGWAGQDLNKNQLIELLKLFRDSPANQETYGSFLETIDDY